MKTSMVIKMERENSPRTALNIYETHWITHQFICLRSITAKTYFRLLDRINFLPHIMSMKLLCIKRHISAFAYETNYGKFRNEKFMTVLFAARTHVGLLVEARTAFRNLVKNSFAFRILW